MLIGKKMREKVSKVSGAKPILLTLKGWIGILGLVICLLAGGQLQAATFFLKAASASNAHLPASWNTVADGSGTNATSFTATGNTFNVPAGISGTISSSVSIGPTGNTGTVAITIDGALTIASGAVLTLQQKNNSTSSLTVNAGGELIFASTNSSQLIGSLGGSGTAANITVVVLADGAIESVNALGISGTSTQSINTTDLTPTLPSTAIYIFNGASQTIAGIPTTVKKLKVSGSNNKSITATLAISDSLIVETGCTLDLGTNAITGASVKTRGTGTLKTQNTSATPIPTGRTWSFTVEFNAAGAQTIVSGTYGALICSTSGTKSLNGDATVSGALTLSGTKLNMGANTLTLNGDFSGSAANCLIGSQTSNLSIGGSGAMSSNLFLDQSNDTAINNFIINRSGVTVTLGSKVKVFGTLTPTAGTLASGGNLVIVSNASATANIASGSGSITGNVVVQRFIPSSARRWRFLASPVTSATLSDLIDNIHITGTGGATNGFDASGSNSASVFTYNETTTGDLNTGWAAASNITNSMTPGKGFRIFVRGTREAGRLTGSITSQDAVTLDFSGTVNSGNINMNPTYTVANGDANDGWNYMGNPYPSAIDWNAFHDAGRSGSSPDFSGTDYAHLDAVVYVYNAATNSYDSYNPVSNGGTLTNGIIPSGAAFWVKASASNPTMTLKESYKSTSTPGAVFKSEYKDKDFRIRLTKDSINSDEMVLKYIDEATASKDAYDIAKMWGAEVNIATLGSDKSYLALNSKPFNGESDTVKLSVYARTTGSYTLNFVNAEEFATNLPMYLLDYYTGDIVDLRTQSTYVFQVNMSNTASYGDSRFELVVGKMPVVILPTALRDIENTSGKLAVYPYIAQSSISIGGLKAGYAQFEIRDLNGRLIQQLQQAADQAGKVELNLNNLPAAMYMVWVQQGLGSKPEVVRFVKE